MLVDEIIQDFLDVQDIKGCSQPFLSDEVDIQEYFSEILIKKPQFNQNDGYENTCLCVNTFKRRWKNQYGEGYCVSVKVKPSTHWSDQDLEEMAYSILPPKVDQVQDFIRSQPPAIKEETSKDSYSNSHTRIQISMKQKSTNVKGRYKNFEISNVPLPEIFSCCQTLLTFFPKLPRKNIEYYTRVQLQNKVDGKMQGGANLSVHNATPEEVYDLLFEMFDGSGWLEPKAKNVPKDHGANENEVNVGNDKEKIMDRLSQSEDGSPKAGNACVSGEGGRGVLYHS